MQTFSIILAIVVVLVLIYQDFMYRHIHWVLLPVLILPLLMNGILDLSSKELGYSFFVNLSFLLLQFLIITPYLYLKKLRAKARRAQSKNIASFASLREQLTSQIGAGDILFLVVLAVAFSPFNFFFFYTGSLLFSLFIFLTYSILKKKPLTQTPFPLVSGIGIAFLAVLVLNLVNVFDPHSDALLLQTLGI
jgi:hypothetical protein